MLAAGLVVEAVVGLVSRMGDTVVNMWGTQFGRRWVLSLEGTFQNPSSSSLLVWREQAERARAACPTTLALTLWLANGGS